jgi:hypothetical protein
MKLCKTCGKPLPKDSFGNRKHCWWHGDHVSYRKLSTGEDLKSMTKKDIIEMREQMNLKYTKYID